MLSETERREIEAEVAESFDRRSAAIAALKIVQRHRGWVSDEALQDTAALLQMTPDELDAVATFYSLIFRQPVGKHVIKVCDSVSCWVMDGESLLSYLEKRLQVTVGGTTSDGLFTLLPIACLGHCDHAPALMIDDTLVGNVTPELLDELLANYRAAES